MTPRFKFFIKVCETMPRHEGPIHEQRQPLYKSTHFSMKISTSKLKFILYSCAVQCTMCVSVCTGVPRCQAVRQKDTKKITQKSGPHLDNKKNRGRKTTGKE